MAINPEKYGILWAKLHDVFTSDFAKNELRGSVSNGKNFTFEFESFKRDIVDVLGELAFSRVYDNDTLGNVILIQKISRDRARYLEYAFPIVTKETPYIIELVNKVMDVEDMKAFDYQIQLLNLNSNSLNLTEKVEFLYVLFLFIRYECEGITNLHFQRNVTKKLEFPPHLKQAGVSILSNFSEILASKYPGDDISVIIEQTNSDKVIMTIKSPDGSILDLVEETYRDYALVVMGKKPPRELLDSQVDIARLENKIDFLTAEIKTSERLIKLQETTIDQFGKLLMAQNTTLNTFAKTGSEEINSLIRQIEKLVDKSMDSADKELVLEFLLLIKKKDSSAFNQLVEFAKGTAYGVSGNQAFQLMQVLQANGLG